MTFVAGAQGSPAGLNYDLENAGNGTSGNTNSLSGNISALDSDGFFGTDDPETLTLTGLNDSLVYLATFYNVGLGSPGERTSDISDGQGGSIVYDQNALGDGVGSLLLDTYSPVGGSITFTFPVEENGFVQFGFSNQVFRRNPGRWSCWDSDWSDWRHWPGANAADDKPAKRQESRHRNAPKKRASSP